MTSLAAHRFAAPSLDAEPSDVTTPASHAAASRTALRLLWATAILLALCTLGRIALTLPGYNQIDQASGVWSSIAYDLADGGVLYRPIDSPNGYGGTRYFPLHPVLQAGLIKLGLKPVPAGFVLDMLSGAALLAGAYWLMRGLGVARAYAAPCAVFVLATASGQWGITTIRGDMLPAALNVWGMALLSHELLRQREADNDGGVIRLWPAAVLFVLAFTSKETTVFGFVASVASLLLTRRYRDSIKLASFWAVGVAIFVVVMAVASHGRFFAAMRACASSDADWQTVFTAPVAMLVLSMHADPIAPVFWMLALAALINAPRSAWREIPALALIATALVTILIFGSPGTSVNHSLDLHVIAVVFFCAQFARQRIAAQLGAIVMSCAVLLSTAGTLQEMRGGDLIARKPIFEHTLAVVRDVKGPVLYEHPMEPILAGEHPYMLDPYMFAVVSAKRPAMAAELQRKMRDHEFGAIVLLSHPLAKGAEYFYDIGYFGKGFRQTLLGYYRMLPHKKGEDYIFVPRTDSAQGVKPLPGETATGDLKTRDAAPNFPQIGFTQPGEMATTAGN